MHEHAKHWRLSLQTPCQRYVYAISEWQNHSLMTAEARVTFRRSLCSMLNRAKAEKHATRNRNVTF